MNVNINIYSYISFEALAFTVNVAYTWMLTSQIILHNYNININHKY